MCVLVCVCLCVCARVFAVVNVDDSILFSGPDMLFHRRCFPRLAPAPNPGGQHMLVGENLRQLYVEDYGFISADFEADEVRFVCNANTVIARACDCPQSGHSISPPFRCHLLNRWYSGLRPVDHDPSHHPEFVLAMPPCFGVL